ncbi:MAG: hypothetical protein KME27_01125 [Lyngbya sp. HA4199-MV5]|jgi:hypothetical protein|nr:hypothetical protein [Lyngbya sp. HA4199-MV5]
MAELSDIETTVLHDIIEDYEAGGMRLDLLIYVIHFYFDQPDSTIADIYQLALDTLGSLEREGLIYFAKQIFQKSDDNHWQFVAEELVSKELALEILRHPKTWSCDTTYDSERYLYIPTDEGVKRFNELA